MTERLTIDEVSDLLHSYILGALDPDEMLAVDDYIQQHRELLQEVERLDGTVAQLALSAPPTTTPTYVKRELMARVWDDLSDEERAQAEADVPTMTPLQVGAVPPAGPAGTQPARGVPPVRRIMPRPGVPMWAATAASLVAVALIIVIGGAYVNVQREASMLRSQIAARESEISTLNQQIDTLEQQLIQEQEQLAVFTGAERVVDLEGTEEAPGVSGEFYQSGDIGVLAVRGLSDLPADSTYQLWLIPAEGAPVPAGLLGGAGATASQRVQIPPDADNYAAVGISIEPAGGSAAPTGPIVALGQS